ncbi:carboxymuconolactone decarboxylase [Arthrobacter sp. SW1]|uniref:carboxymuconolactone decarboxylase family protein n=1 Tax=Arthrobacter sp. SW1 TaxID=1920889 RepID=UPI000877B95B|nr:carboxymuconolactone decarboxylase family protein [Arthrobacter sp. SW1]OFI39509.1 carboxymuconolactone decarboxylase [Arthrobacter sp. SW1]
MSYHDHGDYAYMRKLREGAPDAVKAFAAFDEAALKGESKVISRKYSELIAVAVALTTQCPYCIESHVKAAQAEGATEEELAETVMITSALRAGGGLAHGFMAMKFFEQGAAAHNGHQAVAAHA